MTWENTVGNCSHGRALFLSVAVVTSDTSWPPTSPPFLLWIFASLLSSFSVWSLLSFSHPILLFNKQYKSFALFDDSSPFEPVELLASTPSHPIALNKYSDPFQYHLGQKPFRIQLTERYYGGGVKLEQSTTLPSAHYKQPLPITRFILKNL